MKIEDHLRNINESIEAINFAITKGIEDRQRTIGFNCSVAAIDLLEIYLHKLELINPGVIIKHEWFSSLRRANERISIDFPDKEKIFEIISKIEANRNILCYGKKQPIQKIEETINLFNKLKEFLNSKEEI